MHTIFGQKFPKTAIVSQILHNFIFIFFIVLGPAAGPNFSPSTSRGTSEEDEGMDLGENSDNEDEITENVGEEKRSTGDLILEYIFNLVLFSKN